MLTTTQAKKECDINKGVASSENLDNFRVNTLRLKGVKKIRTEIKEERAQRLHAHLSKHLNVEYFCIPGEQSRVHRKEDLDKFFTL